MKQKWLNKNATLTTRYGLEEKPVLNMQSYLKDTKDMNEYKKLCEVSSERFNNDEENPYK